MTEKSAENEEKDIETTKAVLKVLIDKGKDQDRKSVV